MVNYPQELVAGETFNVSCHDCGFSSASLIIRGPSKADAVGVPSSSQWAFSVDSSEWGAGNYQFELWGVTTDGKKRLVAKNSFLVAASLSGMEAGADVRSASQKCVDALEAYLAGIGDPESDQSVSRYRINNRELFNHSIDEIRRLLADYKKRVARERRKARGLSGAGPSIHFYV